jgi:hypothetical protein
LTSSLGGQHPHGLVAPNTTGSLPSSTSMSRRPDPSMKTATSSWPQDETDPERVEILAAADRLLAGSPTRSTGNLSVVQLAAEADIKYWIIAQKHTDLRDHFQQLAVQARRTATSFAGNHDALTRLQGEHAELRAHCHGLEEHATAHQSTVTTLHPR